jgi:lysophospholipase L1-like esterase
MRRLRLIALLPAAALLGWLVPAPAAAAPALPDSIAALGDSITRAYDLCCSYGDHPGQSWATGGTWYDGIASHYERIARRNGAIAGHAYNDAVTGAKMSAAAGQAALAVAQHAQYVTILLGANDLCTSSPDTMTTAKTFAGQLGAALQTLQGLPAGAHVFVSSLPDIYQLWRVLHANPLARAVWAAAHICQSMLGATRTDDDRQRVAARQAEFNQILAATCGQYRNCRYDGGATFGYKFSAGQVSVLDFFHPDLAGQAALAGVTWTASWWSGL